MLKGNVKVTLFDKDGNVISEQEQSNLVTNASSKILNYCAGANGADNRNLLFNQMPVAEKTLGGLLLFEDSFDNPSADTILMPNDNYIVACANRGVDLTSDRRGSYNSKESGRVTGGYKSVWDFSTFQANNSISALALTSLECGTNPYTCYCETYLKAFSAFYNGNITYDVNNYGIPLKYDVDNQEYYFLYKTATSPKNIYTICKTRIPFYEFEVDDSTYEAGPVSETVYTVEVPESDIQSYYTSIDPVGGYAYLGYEMSGTTLSYIKLNLSTFTYTTTSRTLKNTSSINLTVCNNIWYELVSGKVYSSNEDGTTVHEYTIEGLTTMYNFLISRSNNTVEIMRTDNNAHSGWVLYTDGTLDKFADGAVIRDLSFSFDTDLLLICKHGVNHTFYIKKDYLGTVFNLQTPVPKTSATTMKVEYTLTNVTS